MRWDRLFDELEGHAEHAAISERDGLVADLREGEWAERSWIDGLIDAPAAVEVAVRDVGVLAGTVEWATTTVIHLRTASTRHLIATTAVQWSRGADRTPGLRRDSVQAQLGWGPILREAHDERDTLSVTLTDGSTIDGTVAAVGRDFVRIRSEASQDRDRDVPTAALRMITFRD